MSNPMESNRNRKEEILEKSRRAHKDEGVEYAEKKGVKLGVIAFAVTAFGLLIFSIPNHLNVVYAIASLSFSFCFGGAFENFRFTEKKIYLLSAIGSVIATIAFALMVIIPL